MIDNGKIFKEIVPTFKYGLGRLNMVESMCVLGKTQYLNFIKKSIGTDISRYDASNQDNYRNSSVISNFANKIIHDEQQEAFKTQSHHVIFNEQWCKLSGGNNVLVIPSDIGDKKTKMKHDIFYFNKQQDIKRITIL